MSWSWLLYTWIEDTRIIQDAFLDAWSYDQILTMGVPDGEL